MTYVYICLYKTTFVTKSTVDESIPLGCLKIIKFISGRVYYEVHKWMNSSHEDVLKLLKSTYGRVHYCP